MSIRYFSDHYFCFSLFDIFHFSAIFWSIYIHFSNFQLSDQYAHAILERLLYKNLSLTWNAWFYPSHFSISTVIHTIKFHHKYNRRVNFQSVLNGKISPTKWEKYTLTHLRYLRGWFHSSCSLLPIPHMFAEWSLTIIVFFWIVVRTLSSLWKERCSALSAVCSIK